MRNKLKVLTGIILLMFSISPVSAMAAEKKSKAAGEKSGVSSAGKSQTSFCKEVSKMIKDETIDKYMPEAEAVPTNPRQLKYLNVDIDGDGIADEVLYAAGSEGESLLEVSLSSGGGYYLHESGFVRVLKIKEQIYALVTYMEFRRRPDGSSKERIVGNRLYKLTRHEAERICDTEDFERR